MSHHWLTERFPANCPGNRYWAGHELKVSPRTGVGPAGNSRLTGQKPLPRPGACALCHTISLPNVSRQIVRVTGTGRHMSSKYHPGRGSVLREIADLPAKNPYQGQVLVHYVTPLAYRTFPGKLSWEQGLGGTGAQSTTADGGRSCMK